MAQYLNSEQRTVLIKTLAFLNLVRWFNLILYAITLYLVTYFLFRQHQAGFVFTIKQIATDVTLHKIITCSVLSIAAGYIINAYYDYEKDMADKKEEVVINTFISKRFALNTYFLLLFLIYVLALSISLKALAGFIVFTGLIFYYSHRLKKSLYFANLSNAVLSIFPFIFIAFYFKYFGFLVNSYSVAFSLILLAKDLLKNTEELKGTLLFDYKTIPGTFGIRKALLLCTGLLALAGIFIFRIISYLPIGIHLAFICAIFMLLVFSLFFIANAKEKYHFAFSHHLVKIMVVACVLSLALVGI